MRNFPAQVGPGGEPVSDSASWTSSNANDALQEEQNTITDSGQVLIPIVNPANNTQLSQAIARNAAVATFYADSGAANVYVLSTLGSFKAPTVYLDGQILRWIADNANTTASTINANGVGVVDLVAEGGAALSGGEIDTTKENQARHNLSSGKFELVRFATAFSSEVVQVKNFQTGASTTGTTPIPFDDTIPQNIEGDEFMTLTITPENTNNRLLIEVQALVDLSIANDDRIMALFQDSTADALATMFEAESGANFATILSLTHEMAAGTVSATTFKVRIGGGSASTTTFNGTVGIRRFGGSLASSITITEFLP